MSTITTTRRLWDRCIHTEAKIDAAERAMRAAEAELDRARVRYEQARLAWRQALCQDSEARRGWTTATRREMAL